MPFGDRILAKYEQQRSPILPTTKSEQVAWVEIKGESMVVPSRPRFQEDLFDLLDWLAIASLKLGWVTIRISGIGRMEVNLVQDSELGKRAIAKGITRWADLMDLLDTAELLNLFADEIEYKLEQTNG